MALEPADAITLCAAAHHRLDATLERLDDGTARGPSLLPEWSVGHVLTHIARNADGHVRRLEGALRGEEVPRYPGGPEQRERDIQAGAARHAAELARDIRESTGRLEQTWARCVAAGWPHADLLASDSYPTTASPSRRFREVEVHHVDLGMGYEPANWPDEYLEWELEMSLPRLPQRFAEPAGARQFLAWLIGRTEWPEGLHLKPWM